MQSPCHLDPHRTVFLKQTSRRILPRNRSDRRRRGEKLPRPLIIPVIAFAVVGEEEEAPLALRFARTRTAKRRNGAGVTQRAHLHIFDAQNQPEVWRTVDGPWTDESSAAEVTQCTGLR